MIAPDRMRAPLALALAALMAAALPAVAQTAPAVVRIQVVQEYEYRLPSAIPYLPIEGFDLPVADLVEDMLFAAGIDTLLEDEPGSPDALLRVFLHGRAIGGGYHEPVKAYLYTGASIAGEIVIEQPGRPAVTADFRSERQRPFRIAFNPGYEDPANAPFESTLLDAGGFLRELADALVRAWGVAVVTPSLFESEPALRYNVAGLLGDTGDTSIVPDLVAALDDEHARVRWEAAWSLGRLGDADAIPDLVASLGDPDDDVRWFASWSLRNLTGQEFGTDALVWQAWLDAQPRDTGS